MLVRFTNHLPSRLRSHCEKSDIKVFRAREKGEFALRLCLLVISEAIPMKSHNYAFAFNPTIYAAKLK